MNKKIYILFTLLITGTSLLISSCSSDDDKVDETWKNNQSEQFQKVAKNTEYTEVVSETGNGSIYWQNSTVITDSDLDSKITASGTPEFTDTVSVRYEGWYYQLDGTTKYIFDSTEGRTTGGTTNPNKVPRQFAVNAVIKGWTTALQRMHEGEEKLVVIPQQLAYGGSTSTTIPAYTTLWFRIKLVKIIPMSSRK